MTVQKNQTHNDMNEENSIGASLKNETVRFLASDEGFESVFSRNNWREIWAQIVVTEPAVAFDEIMCIEEKLLQDDPLISAEDRYCSELMLREMHSLFLSAHPQCDWPVLNDAPIAAPFYRH